MPTMLISTKNPTPTTKTSIRDLLYMIDGIKEDHFDMKKGLTILEKYMDINECDQCVFFEDTKRMQRIWMANKELSFRFNVINHESIFDLSFPVNYHKFSGHILMFSDDFSSDENLKQVKEVLQVVFKSKEESNIERIISFIYKDGKIHCRNYLIKDLQEIGPRIDIQLDRIFKGCFKGIRLYGSNSKDIEIDQSDEDSTTEAE